MKYLALLTSSLFLINCGSSDDKKPDPVINYATIVTENALIEDENGTLQLTQVDECALDGDSSLFEAQISLGVSKPTLNVKIKNFSSQGGTYTCSQATDNTTFGDGLGLKYDSCSVKLTAYSDSTNATLNTFAMYRDSETVKSFSYNGECSIEIEYDSPKITGTILCADMSKTSNLEGFLNPPIAEAIDIAEGSSFYCNVQ